VRFHRSLLPAAGKSRSVAAAAPGL
jgi:hypothetical protein